MEKSKNEEIKLTENVTHLDMPGFQEIATNRTYKDSLFRLIYSGNDERSRRWLLSLYNALCGRNYTDINDLRITTIENVIYLTMKNDLSFLLDSQMNLFEHQSTVNPNMPLRGLMYFGQLYQNEVKRQKKDIFGSSLIKIPSPRFIVLYNGDKELPDNKKYRLSDAFETEDKSGEFEWTATLININKNHNETIQKNCESLYHYIEFVDRVRTSQRKGMAVSQAINEAVDYAIQHNFLEGFFEEQKMYITNSLLTEFDQELHDRCTYEDGVAEGAQQNAIANARNFLKMQILTPEQIAQGTGLRLDQVLNLEKELIQA
ncbi:hypothetical protein [Treponema sp.]|uniref:hypothetical protein n=1 Tax=Treponema sp. TaxID=166 RepID=UPI0025DE514F|nr:hypothetical protein [Treponema sp.]MBR4321524.1 hypothetical protein [Treponema sp.]